MARWRSAALIAALLFTTIGSDSVGTAIRVIHGPPGADPAPGGAPSGVPDGSDLDPAASPDWAAAPVRTCGVSAGMHLCLSVPSHELRGDVTVTVAADGFPDEIRFSWGVTPDATDPLLVDVTDPWRFRWATTDYPDGTGYLVARAAPAAGGRARPVSLRLRIANGRATPPAADDWKTRFQPRGTPDLAAMAHDPVIAAVGDSGDGGPTSRALASFVRRSEANLLLYLGDIYEKGTAAEWENNYGTASWADRSGLGRDWGRMAAYTQPVIGNHEAHHRDVWQEYWRGRPFWSTFVYAGVRFLLLDSECGQTNGPAECGPGSPQYEFAAKTLGANTQKCVVTAWHRPVLSPGPQAPAMGPLWRLIASHGGDLVLNGHQHHMQIYQPLNAELQAGRPDSHLVEIVSGAGGHILHRDVSSDVRSRWQAMGVPGALFLTVKSDSLHYEFRDLTGAVARTSAGAGEGEINC